MVVTEEGRVREPVRPEQPSKASAAMAVIVGSRVISPLQQEEEGVFLLIQLSVIPWTEDEKRRRSQKGRQIVGLDIFLFDFVSVRWLIIMLLLVSCLVCSSSTEKEEEERGGVRGVDGQSREQA
jgi:hypothetical protein